MTSPDGLDHAWRPSRALPHRWCMQLHIGIGIAYPPFLIIPLADSAAAAFALLAVVLLALIGGATLGAILRIKWPQRSEKVLEIADGLVRKEVVLKPRWVRFAVTTDITVFTVLVVGVCAFATRPSLIHSAWMVTASVAALLWLDLHAHERASAVTSESEALEGHAE